MYEKHGLMSKITNQEVLRYLRSLPNKTHTEIAETALCRKLGLPPKKYHPKTDSGRKKDPDCRNGLPIKISDQRLVDHVVSQKKQYGILYRHTIESAILNVAQGKKNG